MKGCRLQPKMHPFTMWFNNKYKWLKEFSKYKVCSSNNGGQSTIQQLKYWLQLWRRCNTVNIIQYFCKIFCKCAAENTCARGLWGSWNFLQIAVFNDGKLVFKCQILQKNHPYVNATNHNVNLQFSLCHFVIHWCSFPLSPVSLCSFSLCFFCLFIFIF